VEKHVDEATAINEEYTINVGTTINKVCTIKNLSK